MIKIIHLSDIHILNTERHDEYRIIFEKLYKYLKQEKPNIIVNAGDTFDLFVNISNEAKILAGSLLNNLTLYCDELIQIIGNHDIMKKNLCRVNSIETIVNLINNPKIKYFDKSGFFEDELYPITWVNHSHIQKKIDPWKNISHEKDDKRIYIDLFHDPVYGAKTDTGKIFDDSGIKSTSEFKGDIVMLGDIHKYQVLDNLGKVVYPGSLIQQNAGENPFGHGVVKWEINSNKDIKHEFIEIKNDEFSIIKFFIKPGTDYDKLNLKTTHLARVNQFKVDWTEYAAYATYENEIKIRKYLKDKYKATDIEIKINRIYTDIKDGKMLSEVIDINDKQIQQDIIRKYLKENKFSEEFIGKIIDIDEIINSRLQLSENKNILWNIDKFWFNNFKGYGDNNTIDWNKKKGIVQIAGENQMGKTTILDAICFILYGTTISTKKIEKNGNNRYINRYRKLDFCDGGAVIDINGEKYIMYRRVDRNVDNKGDIKSCPMTLEYYRGSEMLEENKQTDENKVKTQRLLNDVLGDFQDFVRMSLTNADNLNSLLSMDKSVFIDGVIRDAGYDVFEKKLDEFKEWKKSLNLEKINLNQDQTELEIIKLKEELEDNETYLKNINLELSDLEKKLNSNTIKKENLIRTLHKINNSQIDVSEIEYKIKLLEEKLGANDMNVIKLEGEIVDLPEVFDNNKFELNIKKYEKFADEKNKRNLELLESRSKINNIKNSIENVEINIEKEKQIYLNKLESEISNLKNDFNNSVNKIESSYKYDLSKIENRTTLIKSEISNLKLEGIKIKNEILSYENMLNDDKATCPTCNQLIINHDADHINGLILGSNEKLKEILKKGRSKLNEIKEIETEKDNLFIEKSKKINFLESNYIEKISLLKDKIDNFNLDFIKDKIDIIIKERDSALLESTNLHLKIEEDSKFLKNFNIEIEKVHTEISEMRKNKILHDKRKELEHKKDNLISENKDLRKILSENKKLLEEFEKNKIFIKENEEINKSILEIDFVISELKSKNISMNEDKIFYSNQIVLYNKIIKDLETKLKLYKEQILTEELHDVYLKLVHRSGLPTYLLTKNIDLLNKELSNLLTSTNFNLFFDEELNLKIQHNGKIGEINVIETSGMERTFSAIVLKIVLRIINFKSKSNIMFFDEIINRLVGKSVDKFLELLEILKEKIDKIIIIEHNNYINFDYLINVEKDENGVSSFSIIE